MREITGAEYIEARARYYQLMYEFPLHVAQKLPSFDRFISPANYSLANEYAVSNSDTMTLSITGEQRMELLASPNAATLLRAYAARKE